MSKDIEFRVEWDGYHWVAEHSSGGVTQAKNLDRLRANCVEVARLMLDREVGVDDIVLDVSVHVPGVAPDVAATLRELRHDLDALNERLASSTAAAVTALSRAGFPMRDISEVVGLSHQRVAQLLAKARVG